MVIIMIRKKYGFKTSYINSYINTMNIKMRHFPSLVSIESKIPDNMIILNIHTIKEKTDNETTFTIAVGIPDLRVMESPILITKYSNIIRKTEFHEMFNDYERVLINLFIQARVSDCSPVGFVLQSSLTC